jgi:hypothetical protein
MFFCFLCPWAPVYYGAELFTPTNKGKGSNDFGAILAGIRTRDIEWTHASSYTTQLRHAIDERSRIRGTSCSMLNMGDRAVPKSNYTGKTLLFAAASTVRVYTSTK